MQRDRELLAKSMAILEKLRADMEGDKEKKLTLSDLGRYPLVLPSRELQARMMLERLMQGKNFSLASQVELNETNILLQMVSTGNYVTVLSASAVFGNRRFKAVILDEPNNLMVASVLSLKDVYQKASAKEFINILLDTDAVKRRAINCFD